MTVLPGAERGPGRLAALARVGLLAGMALGPAARAPSQGQETAFRATLWTTADGLPQGTVNELLQTDDGSLWIATFGGLLRFDGARFEHLDIDRLPLLPTNRVTALVGDGPDGLWVATQSGDLLRLRSGEVVEAYRLPTSKSEILSLRRGSEGVLWLRTSSGAVHRFERGSWSQPIARAPGGTYEDLAVASDGTVYVATLDELLRLDRSGERVEAYRAPAPVRSILILAQGEVVLGLADGLARLRAGAIERVRTVPPVDGAVEVLLSDGEGGFWLGGREGLRRVELATDGAMAKLSSQPTGLPERFAVRSLLRDREGNLWVGSYGQGLARLTPQRVTRRGAAVGRGIVTALTDDGSGGAWIAYGCDGLARLRSGELEPVPHPLPPDAARGCVQSLLRDGAGRLWLGLRDRLVRIEADGSFAPLSPDLRLPGGVGPMAVGPEQTLWITGSAGRLVRLGGDDRLLEEHAVPGGIRCLAPAADGSLWIGGEGCVWHLRDGRLERFGEEHGVPRGEVRDLLPEADGSVWIATYGGGLGRLSGAGVARLSVAQGLPDSSLSRILDDGRGRLWLLSNRGLIVAERSELADVTEGRAQHIHPVLLGPESGVPEASFGLPAGFRGEDGRLWFGTLAGVVGVDPGQFPFNRVAPRARIERLTAQERELPLSERVRVPALTRRLVFEFTAFALAAPERVRFRYRLRDFDTDWLDAGTRRSVTYTALPPGEFTFEVAARNEHGVWSERPATLTVEVLPAWWQTRAFRAGLVLALVLTVLGLHRRRVAVLDRRARTLLQATEGRARAEERESRLRDELAHLDRLATTEGLATSLAHEVNQPLAAIVANAQAGRRMLAQGGANGELREILGDIAAQGRRASQVIGRLRESLGQRGAERRALDLNQLVRETLPLLRREIEDHRVELALDLDADLGPIAADRVQMQQVLVNLVKNACESMVSTEGPRRLEIRTRRVDGRVDVHLSDSGPGLSEEVRRRLFEPFVTTKAAGMGLGLSISRTIVEAHGGRLEAEPAPAGGALFRIELPAAPEGSGA